MKFVAILLNFFCEHFHKRYVICYDIICIDLIVATLGGATEVDVVLGIIMMAVLVTFIGYCIFDNANQ